MTKNYLSFGQQGTIRLTVADDDFVNGYLAGSLTYQRTGTSVQQTDDTITRLLVATLDSEDHSDRFAVPGSLSVGWAAWEHWVSRKHQTR
jgi:hypothetical protein